MVDHIRHNQAAEKVAPLGGIAIARPETGAEVHYHVKIS